MVSCEKILEAARAEKADIIGLSGLITPSLDEMVHVAKEMQRLGLKQPLLIGGATTSKAHTAVKIEPQYKNNAVVYVPDASRAVGVATQLLSEELRENFWRDRREEYTVIRERNAARGKASKLIPYAQAKTKAPKVDWANHQPKAPTFTGVKVFEDYPLEDLIERIDWTPFFLSWELTGKYPAILQDEVVGEAARQLFDEAKKMLRRMVDEKWITARAVIGFWPAQRPTDIDDTVLFGPEGSSIATLHHLRQQVDKTAEGVCRSLADFVAGAESGIRDYVGAFAVNAGDGVDARVKAFEAQHDDYSAIMLKALADRLAEAMAERMHERVRKEFWGYASDETLSNEALIKEEYSGIRPAPGYPACPDHSEKATLFRLLDAERLIGLQLTDSFAMYPAAAVSGWYFSHPDSRYFNVGKIGKDQVEDYARRKGVSLAQAERWLSPVLAYNPEDN